MLFLELLSGLFNKSKEKKYSLADIKASAKKRKRYPVNLTEFLKEFLKNGQPVDFSKFNIYCAYGRGYSNKSGFYLDASYAFCLTKRIKSFNRTSEVNLACIAFEPHDSGIMVRQIQGARDQASELNAFKWERMLLAIVVDWARKNGLEDVKVIKGTESAWCTEKRGHQFFLRYDITARRSGFKPNGQHYVLKLT